MKKINLSLSLAFFALTVCLLSSKTSIAQSEKFISKWVITPEKPEGIISHLTISKKGNGFEVSRTKAPDERWSALFDAKNQKLIAILDGKMVYFTYDSKTDRLMSYDSDTNKKLDELKKE